MGRQVQAPRPRTLASRQTTGCRPTSLTRYGLVVICSHGRPGQQVRHAGPGAAQGSTHPHEGGAKGGQWSDHLERRPGPGRTRRCTARPRRGEAADHRARLLQDNADKFQQQGPHGPSAPTKAFLQKKLVFLTLEASPFWRKNSLIRLRRNCLTLRSMLRRVQPFRGHSRRGSAPPAW